MSPFEFSKGPHSCGLQSATPFASKTLDPGGRKVPLTHQCQTILKSSRHPLSGADCERGFSQMKIQHTHLRNRLVRVTW